MAKIIRVLGIIAAIVIIVFGIKMEIPRKYVSVSSYSKAYDYDWSRNVGAQYLGGDAYNYQVEASLKAGYLTSVYVAKSVSIIGGILLLFISLYSLTSCIAQEKQIKLLEAANDRSRELKLLEVIAENTKAAAEPVTEAESDS